MRLKDCMEKGLLKKNVRMKDQVERELKEGDRFLELAKRDKTDLSLFGAYSAIFHYARALLFSKGYSERSHLCLFSAINEMFPELSEEIKTANKIRITRHSVSYSGMRINKNELKFIIEFAENFGTRVKRVLEGN